MGLDDYRLLGQTGAGRDGVAYQAASRDGGTPVELIRLDPARDDPPRWTVLTRRLKIASGLTNPSSRRVVESGVGNVPPYVVLSADDRPSLFENVESHGEPPLMAAMELVGAVAEALAEAHRLGLVHGRVDPWDVRWSGGSPPAIDLTGIDAGRDEAGRGPHFPSRESFRPPESRAGIEPTAESDVFGLGRLAAWLISGDRVATAGTLHDGLAVLLTSMTSADPFDRPSASEVGRRLGVILGELATHRTEVATGERDAGATGDWAVDQGTPTEEVSVRLTGGGAAAPGVDGNRPAIPDRFGRYRIVAKLGAGGMGDVYKAVDEADGKTVAVKVLRPEYAERPNALKRFRKEARMLARVRNPYVTNLLDVNDDGGIHYIVLEFVDGESLDFTLATRKKLDEPTVLAVGADVARGLMDAHRLGIVHRDVKPSNILVVSGLNASPSGEPRVKLSDFGLARQAIEELTQGVTQDGVVVGTPTYMAPEQCSGGALSPGVDVYALGATLFHLIAGRPPFVADDWRGLIARHMNEPPPPLRSINPEVSDGFARVVARALEKVPGDRYSDAEAFLSDLERLLRGEPTGLPVHPALPATDPAHVLAFDFSWDLDAPPRALWPHVANTDRVDRALGFGAVKYALKFDPSLGVRRFLEGRKAGMAEAGEEHPYEWVEGRRLGVFREYTHGPFVWVVSVVELAPRGANGTTLTHRLRIEPRGRMIRFGSKWGVGSRLKKDLEKVYRRIDAALTGRLGTSPALDPFEPPPAMTEPRRKRLEELLAALEARGVAPEVVDALGGFLVESPAAELARIRPIALARRLGLVEDDVVSACLHAANVGLLVLLWDLLCPVCRIPADVKETLRAIAEHGHCEACQTDFVLDFANSVELVFRSHPQVREADTNTYCAAGPAHSPHVVAQVRLAPGERMELDLALGEGAYKLRGPQLGWSFDFRVRPGETTRRWDLSLSHGPAAGLAPGLAPGTQILALTNDADRPLVVRVERVAPRDDALTAARASALAVFRELFPAEVLAPGRLVSISEVTLLLTDLDLGAASLYQEMGDARAFAVLHEQFRRIDGVVRGAGGAVVKTVGEGVFAAFSDPDSAVRAGLAIPAELAASELTRGLAPRLRLSAHRGAAMAATVNDHLDYFGHTVHEALRALGLTPPGTFVLSRPVASDPQVADQLRALGLTGTVLADEPASSAFGPLLRLDLYTPPRSLPGLKSGPGQTEATNGAAVETVMVRTG